MFALLVPTVLGAVKRIKPFDRPIPSTLKTLPVAQESEADQCYCSLEKDDVFCAHTLFTREDAEKAGIDTSDYIHQMIGQHPAGVCGNVPFEAVVDATPTTLKDSTSCQVFMDRRNVASLVKYNECFGKYPILKAGSTLVDHQSRWKECTTKHLSREQWAAIALRMSIKAHLPRHILEHKTVYLHSLRRAECMTDSFIGQFESTYPYNNRYKFYFTGHNQSEYSTCCPNKPNYIGKRFVANIPCTSDDLFLPTYLPPFWPGVECGIGLATDANLYPDSEEECSVQAKNEFVKERAEFCCADKKSFCEAD